MAEQCKLVTIMALDGAGYSRAPEKDESAMVAAVGRIRTAIADLIGVETIGPGARISAASR